MMLAPRLNPSPMRGARGYLAEMNRRAERRSSVCIALYDYGIRDFQLASTANRRFKNGLEVTWGLVKGTFAPITWRSVSKKLEQ